MITPVGRKKDLQRIAVNLDYVLCTVDDVQKKVPLHSTKIQNDILHIYVFLDDQINGMITKFEVIDKQGEVYIERIDKINKSDFKGIYVAFSCKYNIREVNNVLH
ncbi:hypothetical protein EEL31_23910 [Brevibacillus laterosporus]|nr:hypothetical protein [Brevibacillus laterosporus]TPG71177.1 hypothetical protein EEL31_23910 [Brevibacillus laterosporus]